MQKQITKQIEICNIFHKFQKDGEMDKILSGKDESKVFKGLLGYTSELTKRCGRATEKVFIERWGK